MKYQSEVARGVPNQARLFGSSYANWPAVGSLAVPKNNHIYHDTSLYDEGVTTRKDLLNRAKAK